MGFMDAIKTGTSYSSKIGGAGLGLLGGPGGVKDGWEKGDDFMGKKYREKDDFDKFKEYVEKRDRERTTASTSSTSGKAGSTKSTYAMKDLLAYIQKMNISDGQKADLMQKVLAVESA